MAHAAMAEFLREGRATSRPSVELHEAALLAAALLGACAQRAGGLPIDSWADANRLARDPRSLLNLTPPPPGGKAPHG